MKLKKGDKVIVVAGKSRGQTGTITKAMPKENKVLIDGVNMVKRHRKATTRGGSGQIVDIAVPIDVSNVMIADPKTGKPTRVKIVRGKEGERERVATKSGQSIK